MFNLAWCIELSFLSMMIEAVEKKKELPFTKKAEASTRYAALAGRNPENNSTEVRVISCYGPIIPFANLFSEVCGSVSVEAMRKEYSAALADPQVKTILFDFNSPGGNVEEIAAFAGEIYASRGQKKTVAFAGGLCCSAAYWLAAATDKIYTDKTTKTGSIGVMTTLSKTDDGKINLTNTSSNLKAVDASTEQGKEEIVAILNDTAAVFFEDVARFRPQLTVADIGDLKGRVFVGAKALKHKLVDEITDFNSLYQNLTQGESQMMTAEEKAAYDAALTKADTLEKANNTLSTQLKDEKEKTNEKLYKASYDAKLDEMKLKGFKDDSPTVANFKSMFGDQKMFSNTTIETIQAKISGYQVPQSTMKVRLGDDEEGGSNDTAKDEIPAIKGCV